MDTVSAFAGIAERVDAVRARISAAAHRAGRDPHAITLIAVTKTVACDAIRTARAAGVRDFGENRVQEMTAKVSELQSDDLECRWHLIGHLQHNKVRKAVQARSVIHSIDTLEIAGLVGSAATDLPGPVDVFAQVNVSAEASKSGFALDEFRAAAADLAAISGLRWQGLMTIAAENAGPTELHETFASLRRLLDDTRGEFSQHPWNSLSMGMTNDFEIAIEEGATHVRVGRAIFGDRARHPTGGPL